MHLWHLHCTHPFAPPQTHPFNMHAFGTSGLHSCQYQSNIARQGKTKSTQASMENPGKPREIQKKHPKMGIAM